MVTNCITETIESTVGRVNSHGFTLAGRDGWVNLSKYASPVPALPDDGAHVLVGVDKAGYAREITVLGSTVETSTSGDLPQVASAAPVGKDRQIIRMHAVTSAIAMLATAGPIADDDDVLALAARVEAWVLR